MKYHEKEVTIELIIKSIIPNISRIIYYKIDFLFKLKLILIN